MKNTIKGLGKGMNEHLPIAMCPAPMTSCNNVLNSIVPLKLPNEDPYVASETVHHHVLYHSTEKGSPASVSITDQRSANHQISLNVTKWFLYLLHDINQPI